jgi:hypothetical protein
MTAGLPAPVKIEFHHRVLSPRGAERARRGGSVDDQRLAHRADEAYERLGEPADGLVHLALHILGEPFQLYLPPSECAYRHREAVRTEDDEAHDGDDCDVGE